MLQGRRHVLLRARLGEIQTCWQVPLTALGFGLDIKVVGCWECWDYWQNLSFIPQIVLDYLVNLCIGVKGELTDVIHAFMEYTCFQGSLIM